MTKYNQTELYIERAMERNIMHRDYFAHYIRWDYVSRQVKSNQVIWDFGCGCGELAIMLYANKYSPREYIGFDVNAKAIAKARERVQKDNFAFVQQDLVEPFEVLSFETPDIITCFEVIEHIGHENIDGLLSNIWNAAGPETKILFSTPVYDPSVGAAGNHMIEGKVGEWEFQPLADKFSEYFVRKDVFGTFASIRDYKDTLDPETRKVFDFASTRLGTNMLSVFMAPLVDPKLCRNCLWIMKKGNRHD